MLTHKEYKTLSPARRSYIEKQAAKRGLSVEDYLVNKRQPLTGVDIIKEKFPDLISTDDAINMLGTAIDTFKPDFGMQCHKDLKTEYKMNMLVWSGELMNSMINKIPHRLNEFTMEVPYQGKSYMATFKMTPDQRQEIAMAMIQGCMGFTIRFKVQSKQQTGMEWIRVCKVTDITPSKETFDVGGEFMITSTQGSTTLKQLAVSFNNPSIV